MAVSAATAMANSEPVRPSTEVDLTPVEATTLSVTVCIPVYNGARTIADLVEEVIKELSPYYLIDFVLVNDYGKDDSDEVCRQLASRHDFIKYIALRKNFG